MVTVQQLLCLAMMVVILRGATGSLSCYGDYIAISLSCRVDYAIVILSCHGVRVAVVVTEANLQFNITMQLRSGMCEGCTHSIFIICTSIFS